MSTEWVKACEHLLSATANGLYQGLLVAALAALTLRMFGRTNAATRHAVWFGTLLLVAALIPAHLLLSSHSRAESNPSIASPGHGAALNSLAINSLLDAPTPPDVRLAVLESQSTESNDTITTTTPALIAISPVESVEDKTDSMSSFTVAPAETASTLPAPELQMPSSRAFEASFSLPSSICLCLVAVWILIASIRGRGLALGLADVLRSKKTSHAPSGILQTRFEKLCESLGVRRQVQLRISDTHRTAVVLGFLHPVILLPSEMDAEANSGEVEDVLRHELAHVARWDDWANLIQLFIQCALFFHPAIWWISRRLALEREIACDDHVLHANSRPRAYALTLANVASRLNQRRHLLAPGVSNNNSQLKQRINMILNTQRNRSPRLAGSRFGFATLVTALLAVLAISAGPRLVLAQSPEVAEIVPDRPGSKPATLPPNLSGDVSEPTIKDDSSDEAPVARIVLDGGLPVASVAPVPAMPAGGVPPPAPPPSVAPVPPMTPPGFVGYGVSAPALLPAPRAMKRNMSIEERLDRIERMLEKLDAHAPGATFYSRNKDGVSVTTAVKPQVAYSYSYSTSDANKMEADAKRAAEASQRAFEEATRNFAQRGKDFERLEKQMREMGLESKVSAGELQALRSARESLNREMQSLDRQIKQLEENMNSKPRWKRDRQDDSDDAPQPEKPSAGR